MPAAAEDLVRALVRSRPLIPVARLHTDRTPIEVSDETGRTLAEIVDDHVTVYRDKHNTDEFREVEVEVFAAGRVGDRLLSAATDRLVAAGCRDDPPIPKLVRALGRRALEVPEPTVPPVDRDTSLGNLVRHAIARCVSQVLRHDPGVRLGDDPEDVHLFRVGARRLRSDLRTFAPLLEPAPLAELRDELRWLGAAVGAVRDNDVLAERLRTQAGPLPEPDAAGVQALMGLLAAQADTAAPPCSRPCAAIATSPCSTRWCRSRTNRPSEPSTKHRPTGPPLARRPASSNGHGGVLTTPSPTSATNPPTPRCTGSASSPNVVATRSMPSLPSLITGPRSSRPPSPTSRPCSATTKTPSSPKRGYATPQPPPPKVRSPRVSSS